MNNYNFDGIFDNTANEKKDQTFQEEIYRYKAEFDKKTNYNDLVAE